VTIDEIIEFVDALGGVLILRPAPGDGSPEISWGDVFFYYAPDGVVPRAQPFATIVTKDYPGDDDSRLDRPDAFRVNISAATSEFVTHIGREPRESATGDADPSTADPSTADPSTADTVIAHPVYGNLGWLAVVNPGERTDSLVRGLLRSAHDRARARYQRRAEHSPG
jgi:hypothetical protein